MKESLKMQSVEITPEALEQMSERALELFYEVLDKGTTKPGTEAENAVDRVLFENRYIGGQSNPLWRLIRERMEEISKERKIPIKVKVPVIPELSTLVRGERLDKEGNIRRPEDGYMPPERD